MLVGGHAASPSFTANFNSSSMSVASFDASSYDSTYSHVNLQDSTWVCAGNWTNGALAWFDPGTADITLPTGHHVVTPQGQNLPRMLVQGDTTWTQNSALNYGVEELVFSPGTEQTFKSDTTGALTQWTAGTWTGTAGNIIRMHSITPGVQMVMSTPAGIQASYMDFKDCHFITNNITADLNCTGKKANNLGINWAVPTWFTGYPTVTSVAYTSATMNFKSSYGAGVDTTGYFVVVPNNAGAPSDVQIAAGQNSSGNPVATGFSGNVAIPLDSTVYSVGATDMTGGVNYDAYFTMLDSFAGYSSVEKVDFYTPVPPSTALNFFLSSQAFDGTNVTSQVNLNVLVAAIQANFADPLLDTTAEVGPVYVYYTQTGTQPGNGRQTKRIVHGQDTHLAHVQWSTSALDGIWEKTKVKAYDKDGAYVILTRAMIGSDEDIEHAEGIMTLNTGSPA
jgi:hypothetical protein